MNGRGMIAAAALICTAAGCATTQGGSPQAAPQPGARTQAALAQGAAAPGARGREEEYQFNGYTLKVQLDDGGLLLGAKAFKDRTEVPTFVVPAREVTVCVPRAAAAAQGAGQQCEPFLYMPEKTFFKIGTGTLCSMWYQGRLIYYQC